MTRYTLHVETDDADLLAEMFTSLALATGEHEDDLETLVVPTAPPAQPGEGPIFVAQVQDDLSAHADRAALLEGPIARAFREFLIGHVARLSGRKRADVRDAVARVEVDSGRPLLDWLMNGGFQQLIQLILSVLSLFGGPKLANVA